MDQELLEILAKLAERDAKLYMLLSQVMQRDYTDPTVLAFKDILLDPEYSSLNQSIVDYLGELSERNLLDFVDWDDMPVQ